MTALPAVDDGAALLERAVGYTRGCLALVRPDLLDRPTPCAGWDLRALLAHMDDSLAVFTEAAEVGAVAVDAGPGASATLERLRARACALVAAWSRPVPASVTVAGHPVRTGLLAAAGSLEVAVHGWDVSVACGRPRPLPPALALDLLATLPLLVTDADRPARFGRGLVVPAGAGASTRLLAALGRRTPPR